MHAEAHLLGLMRIQVDDLVILAAYKVEGGAGAPPHNANALAPGQHLLQLGNIPLIHLQDSTGFFATTTERCALRAGQ